MDKLAKITRKVPIPKQLDTRDSRRKYPFHKMKVGDSFWAPRSPSILMSCAYRSKIVDGNKDWKFHAANEKSGARIWRIK
jgi:hypothetical protein